MSAWTVIAHTEVGSGGAANITFSSIAASYTDLAILLNARSTRAGSADDNVRLSLNGSTSNFSSRYLYGQGSTTTSSTETNYAGQVSAATATASTFGSTLIYIPNYTSTVAKSYSVDSVSENNATFAVQVIIAGLWNPASNVAITSLAISCGNGNLTEFSSATLYGITKGSSGGVTVS